MLLYAKSRSVPTFRKRLLAWYDANKRPLPWRKDREPYRVWLSEIMLQQTRVAAVIDHYGRFLTAFPDVNKLAAASEQKVLAQWSGLGYYRRARMMHAAAKKLVAQGGEFPRTASDLCELPGIGRYTAAAIASIAFDEPIAVVDGNVERVLQRLAGDRARGLDYWSAAQELINAIRPGDFNQAMMELGAIVCLPKNPHCNGCPVKRWCGTRGEHKAARTPARKHAVAGYLAAVKGSKIALVQRPTDARLMPDMWELPQLGLPLPRSKPSLTLRHSITTTDYVVKVWSGIAPSGSKAVAMSRAASLPLTGLTRKILKRLSLLNNQTN